MTYEEQAQESEEGGEENKGGDIDYDPEHMTFKFKCVELNFQGMDKRWEHVQMVVESEATDDGRSASRSGDTWATEVDRAEEKGLIRPPQRGLPWAGDRRMRSRDDRRERDSTSVYSPAPASELPPQSMLEAPDKPTEIRPKGRGGVTRLGDSDDSV